MTDEVETTVAPSAMDSHGRVRNLQSTRARRTGPGAQGADEHIFGQVAVGETDRQRLVVSGLAYLKSLERTSVEANEIRSDSQRSDGDRDFTAPAKSS
jgi:hypothetical protein